MRNIYIMLAALLSLPCASASADYKSSFTTADGKQFRKSIAAKTVIPIKNPEILRHLDLGEGDEMPVTELPDNAVRKNYTVSGMAWSTMWGFSSLTDFADLASHMGVCENGDVYIYNPIAGANTRSYLKGTMEGDKITVRLPQILSFEDYGDDMYSKFYAVILKHESGDPENEEDPGTFEIYEDSQTLQYTKYGDDFDIDLPDDGSLLLGMVYSDFTGGSGWGGCGDYKVTYQPFLGELVEVPAGLSTEKWAFTDDFGNGKLVDIGFYGTDVYMKGFSSFFPDSWIKGSVIDNTVSFPSGQYTGIDEMLSIYDFFMSSKGSLERNPETGEETASLTLTSSCDFLYDKETKRMTTTAIPLINASLDYVYYLEAFPCPVIRYQPADINQTPSNPSITGFEPYNEDYGQGTVTCNISNLNVDGYILDENNLFFRIYINGEPVTFSPDKYFGLEEEMTLIPATFDTFDFYKNGPEHTITLFQKDIETIGVQSVYRLDGKDHESEICTLDNTSVESIAQNTSIARTELYTLQGIPVHESYKGLAIRVTHFSNGTVKHAKVVIK